MSEGIARFDRDDSLFIRKCLLDYAKSLRTITSDLEYLQTAEKIDNILKKINIADQQSDIGDSNEKEKK